MNNEIITSKQLKQFGYIVALGAVLIFGLFFPMKHQQSPPLWPYIVGGTFLLLSLLKPELLRILYQPWMRLGLMLGWLNSRIILGLVYFLMITPTAIIRRFLGKDILGRRYDLKCQSYRSASKTTAKQQMERPY